ncbi:hypothetical protein C8A01DRAFT_14096 [Parachaetomium inaequale]|uniref:Carboxylesterase family protein n=1 Tax=Parachaetomium inaequale TaxID=2588326 RepID=A0AAN6PKE2_9PEZI|nr:hypothetical protein C8A01DRAFT_14096 [Parachaetomium inaequale]
MATTSRPRPCAELDIHDDHSHKEVPLDTTTSALGELPLNNIHNIRRKTSIESLARRLDNFHIYNSDKENKSRTPVEAASRVPSAALSTKDITSDNSHEPGTSPVSEGRRPRGDSHGDAELRQGEKTLYFGCNLVNRGPQSDGALESGKSTDVYTLLATRVKAEEEFIIERAPVFDKMEMAAAAEQLRLSGAPMAGRHYDGFDVPKSPGLAVEVNEVAADLAGDRSRPLSRIEDSVEALDKLEEEIEALTQVAQLERVLSPEAATRNFTTSAKSTPLKRAATVRAPNSARSKTLERSSSVRQSTSAGDDDKATTSSARKVPRPTSLLPPKPLARSSKTPTVSTFELPGEAVARRLKEQREQRRSQQVSSDQAAAVAAAYSPSKPHFKSTKIPTRPTFELPGEAISRAKREAREAKLRAQEEEERKRREFKARPIRAGLVAPSSVPRDTLASLARQKSRGSADSGSPTVATTATTPVAKKRQSAVFSSSSTLPTRGRNPTTTTPTIDAKTARATSASTVASIHSSRSGNSNTSTGNPSTGNTNGKPLSAEEKAAQQQRLLRARGREVFARESSYTAEREREKRERENAAREARERAAERGRELSRVWAERQKLKVRGG